MTETEPINPVVQVPENKAKPDPAVPPVKGMRDQMKAFTSPESAPAAAPAEPKPAATEPAKPEPDAKPTGYGEISDEPEKPKAAEPAPDEPRTGEKPAQFIARLKKERADLQNTVKQLREQAEKGPKHDDGEIKSLREQIDALSKELEISAIERSPKFRRDFIERRQNLEQQARNIAKDLTEDQTLIDRALALHGKNRWALLDDEVASSSAVAALANILTQIDGIESEKAAALSQHQEYLKTLPQEQEANDTGEVLKAFDSMLPDLEKRLSLFRKVEGNAEHNKAVEQRISLARSFLDGSAAPEDIIRAAGLAAAAPDYIAALRVERAKTAELEARLAEYEKAEPRINGRGTDTGRQEPAVKADGTPLTMRERMKQWVNT